METSEINLKELMMSGVDYLNITISKDSVVNNDISAPMKILSQLIASKSTIEYFRERVDISFEGYNDTNQNLYEIPEVRNFVITLDSEFPFWLFFLTKNGRGLFVIIKCFLLPFLKPEAEKSINGKRLQEYLQNRGFLAMNQLCELVNLSEQENILMTNRLVSYLTNK